MAPPRKKKDDEEPPDKLEMINSLAKAFKKQANEPNMHAYQPHTKQRLFHQSDKTVRLYIGGNRSGKSVGGVIEDLWWVTGRHPYRKVPDKTIHGRVLGVDFINGVQGILLPIFKRWIVPSDLIDGSWERSWSLSERTLTLANGNEIDFKSYDQDLDKHAGTSRDFIHFDEEPPRRIFEENLIRTIDVGGSVWITMTPVQGLTWTYNTLYLPGKSGEKSDLAVVEVDMADNPYLSVSEKMTALAFLDDDERAKREHGKFVPRGGLVYPDFMASVHGTLSATWRPPRDWLIYHSLDHGYNNPTASLHHAVSPDGGSIVTFHEQYGREKIVQTWAREIIQWEVENDIEPFLRTGDPAMKQRQAQSGNSIQTLYAEEGVYFALDSVPKNVSVGVDKINNYLRPNPGTGMPFWQCTLGCPNLIREMKALHWDYYTSPKLEDSNNSRETIHKKDDHAPDALRYFFTFLPDLSAMGLDMMPAQEHTLDASDVGTIWDYIDKFGPGATQPDNENWNITVGYNLMEVEYD